MGDPEVTPLGDLVKARDRPAAELQQPVAVCARRLLGGPADECAVEGGGALYAPCAEHGGAERSWRVCREVHGVIASAKRRIQGSGPYTLDFQA